MKTIKITIDPVGKPTVEANGFVGTECASKTKPIEDALKKGSDDVVTEHKPEYNEIDSDNNLTL